MFFSSVWIADGKECKQKGR